MRTIKLTIAYDGSGYTGWQMQGGERPTLQAAVEAALSKVLGGEPVRVTGSSRTDAGVHALGQVVSFHTASRLTPAVILRAMNAELPDDISVLAAAEARFGFHSIRDSVGKRYRYVIQHGRTLDVFLRHYAWHVRRELDVDTMREAARSLVGTHDFAAYQNQGSVRDSTVRTVHELSVTTHRERGFEQIWIEVEGNGFLYMMVRNIVGTLVEVGRGNHGPAWPAEVLAGGDRRQAGMSAPAQGLFLLRIWCDDDPAAVAKFGLKEPRIAEIAEVE